MTGFACRAPSLRCASLVADQVMAASEAKGPGDLDALIRSNGTWTVD